MASPFLCIELALTQKSAIWEFAFVFVHSPENGCFDYENVEKATSLTYSPLKGYGGWSIRYGRKGKAYNVSGNKRVLLTLKDGKSVLIGSKNPELLSSAINEHL